MDQNKLQYIFGQLSVKPSANMLRHIQSLSNFGDYASWNVEQGVSEVLLKATDSGLNIDMPSWDGMRFSIKEIELDYLQSYIVMELLDKDLEVPFACFCADIIQSLIDAMPEERTTKIFDVIYMWDQFFTHKGKKTLSKPRQRGLMLSCFGYAS